MGLFGNEVTKIFLFFCDHTSRVLTTLKQTRRL